MIENSSKDRKPGLSDEILNEIKKIENFFLETYLKFAIFLFIIALDMIMNLYFK